LISLSVDESRTAPVVGVSRRRPATKDLALFEPPGSRERVRAAMANWKLCHLCSICQRSATMNKIDYKTATIATCGESPDSGSHWVGSHQHVYEPPRPHIVKGKFQSDKYPTCPPGKFRPSRTQSPDLLWFMPLADAQLMPVC
jgi:hypothetical protein